LKIQLKIIEAASVRRTQDYRAARKILFLNNTSVGPEENCRHNSLEKWPISPLPPDAGRTAKSKIQA